MKIKYVILNEICPVIFSECNQHADFKYVGKPTSAGFLDIQEVDAPATAIHARMFKVTCYGESVSLNLKPGPLDVMLLEKLLNSD